MHPSDVYRWYASNISDNTDSTVTRTHPQVSETINHSDWHWLEKSAQKATFQSLHNTIYPDKMSQKMWSMKAWGSCSVRKIKIL